jgi:polyphenol oxidase
VIISAPTLRLPGLRHGFFNRHGGVSDGPYATLNGGLGSRDRAASIAENRERIAQALGVNPQALLTAYQTHSPDVVIVDSPWSADARPHADAIVTRALGLAIGVTTADCGPILLADPVARVIGAAHAGWRGALAGIVDATVSAMESLGAQPERICAVLGPMIRQQNYEVGPDLITRFVAEDAANGRFFAFASGARDGHALFDLAGYIRSRLLRAGIRQVEDLALCTYGDAAQFFSFRRSTHLSESDYGRHVSAIALEESPAS